LAAALPTAWPSSWLSLALTDSGHVGWRIGGKPVAHVIALHTGLGNRRHIGQLGAALLRRVAQRTQLAGLDLRHAGGDVGDHQVDLAAQQVGDGQRIALVGHMQDVHIGQLLEHLAGYPAGRAAAAKAELARVGLGIGQQLAHRLVRRIGRHHQHLAALAQAGNRREVLDRVIG